MSQPRKHHYIPVFYLKQWTNTNGKLIEYSRTHRGALVAKPVGPKSTGFQRDLYAFADCPAEIAQYLEREFLKRTDSLAAKALSKLFSGNAVPWTAELRSAWSRFTINFLVRHPHPFAEIKAALHDSWLRPDDVTEQEYERLRQADDPPTFREWVLLQGNNLADRIRIRLIQTAMDNDAVGERFNAMLWDVLDVSRSRFRLLTSDWPLHKEINGERMLFLLPISPSVLFTAATHVEIFQNLRRTQPDELVKKINEITVSRARLYVYSSDRNPERFISRRMSSSMVAPPFFPTLSRNLAV